MNLKRSILSLFFIFLAVGIFSNLSAQIVNFAEVYQKTVLGAVYISVPNAYGSGFQINSDGYIVTNHHVIEDDPDGSIFVFFKNGEKFEASVLASIKAIDLALLKISANRNGIIPILPSGDVEIGSAVMAIGKSKIDKFFSQQPGSVNNLGNDHKIHHNASIAPGFSGGPLINQEGYIVGVNSGGRVDTEKERNFAIKASYLRAFLESAGVNYSTQSAGVTQPGIESKTVRSTEQRTGYGSMTFYSLYGFGGKVQIEFDGVYVGTLTKYFKPGEEVGCNNSGGLTVTRSAGTYLMFAKDEAGHTWTNSIKIQEGQCGTNGLRCDGCLSTKNHFEGSGFTYIDNGTRIGGPSGRLEYEDPARIAFKIGGGGQYYMMPVDAPKRYTDNNYTAKDVSWMAQAGVGYRLAVNPETNRGQIFGIFANVGNLNDKGVKRLAFDQKVVENTQNTDFKNLNLYKELEAGFVFGEWFRLTGGGGMQDIHYADGRTKTLKYFTATSGFSMRIGIAFEWDVNATFMFPGEFAHPSYRLNTSLNVRFNAFRF